MDGKESIRFYDDGQFTFAKVEDGVEILGRYGWLPDNRMKLQFEGLLWRFLGPQVVRPEFNGDKLLIVMPDGDQEIYRRLD